jgi:hypothetical protein
MLERHYVYLRVSTTLCSQKEIQYRLFYSAYNREHDRLKNASHGNGSNITYFYGNCKYTGSSRVTLGKIFSTQSYEKLQENTRESPRGSPSHLACTYMNRNSQVPCKQRHRFPKLYAKNLVKYTPRKI